MPDDVPMTATIAADLLDLDESLTLADKLVQRGRDAYDNDAMLRLAAEAISNRLGEAAQRLDADWRESHPGVPWQAIRDNRNFVVHVYQNVDYDQLWNTLAVDVPVVSELLADQIAAARAVLATDAPGPVQAGDGAAAS